MAEGPYKIVEVAEVADRPGMLRLKLQALADPGVDGEFALDLPQATVAKNHLAAGQWVSARVRPYGVEFAHADTQQAFFLLLSDDWVRELPSRPVAL